MRIHGYQSDTEPWRYGPEAQRIIAACLRERMRLLPYIYSCAAAVSERGQMLMRPLVFDFPGDEEALRQETEYMFGPSLLICPVTQPDVTSWRVYLPKTTGGWTEWHTGNHYEGGRHADIPVDVATIPVFARDGSITPLAGDTLALMRGADATFTLYEDDGTSFGYERGQASRITFHWNQEKQQLTIDRRRGSYPGMPLKRRFTIQEPYGTARTIDYNGKAVKLNF
jgi:alpha-D-xyloside xylohydrolase